MQKIKNKTNIKLPLTDLEKANLRKNNVKIADLLDFAADELEVLLNASSERAKEIYALAEFQTVPSVGIKFAEDLMFLGYYSINELKNKDGAKLTEEYERKKGYWTDPCVENQFRLIVNFANTNDRTKKWRDFTGERKKYRIKMVIRRTDLKEDGMKYRGASQKKQPLIFCCLRQIIDEFTVFEILECCA